MILLCDLRLNMLNTFIYGEYHGQRNFKASKRYDIRGIAMNVEGEDVNLTRYNALAIGAAFAHWLGF